MTASLKRALEILKEDGSKTLAKKSLTYVIRFLHSPHFLLKVGSVGRGKSLENLVDFTMKGCYGLISPFQDKKEILGLIKLLDKFKPRTLIEIGTASGGTLFLFSRIASDDATLVSVDLPYGKFGGGYPNWKIPIYKSFALKNQKIHLIRENSHDVKTFGKVKNILGGRKADFIFIDGDHTYEGAKRDFELYRHLLKKGGVLGLHDIVPHTKESGCDVFRFWNEIKKKYKHKEIVNGWNKQ